MNETSQEPTTLSPMPLSQAVLFFGIPAVVVVLGVYVGIPYLNTRGFSEFNSYALALAVPLVLLLVASLIAYRLEGNASTRAAFKERFRLRRMERRDWLWTAGLLVFMLLSYGFLISITHVLVAKGIIGLPDSIPTIIDPRAQQSIETMANALGDRVKGNWSLAVVTFILLFFNIFGEEFWWRGYILPRQELAHGKSTWVIHGVLWTLVHAFKWWEYIALLPVCLAIAFVSQRLKNTWPAIITHYALNGLGLIGIVLLILGVGQ